jgi:ubiquinone/menaquinone biosynthesis C-methylase UbiE
MTVSSSKIQSDFDRIAVLSNAGWDHNSHYHSYLLKHISSSGSDALEIGCGTGSFTRLLAQRFRRVLALDLSPRMIEMAKERSGQYSNIDFQVADATTYEFPSEQFDCVASIATLHHLPFEPMFSQMKSTLKAGGTLLILDLFQAESLADVSTGLLAVPVNIGLSLLKRGWLREPAEVRAAWLEHGRTDTYLTLAQVRRASATILPLAQVKRHLLWRYSIVWKKEPVATCQPAAG